jgi:hypothetical protein
MPNLNARYSKTLVEAIFFEQDQQLLKAFHERLEKIDRRTQFARICGISDEAILDRLIELDIAPEALAAMEVVPLVLVAWADGAVQAEERAEILATVAATGIQPQDARYPVLEHWLKRRPGAGMLEAWRHYVHGLCLQMERPEIEKLRQEVLDRARKVAQAAGGFWGFGNKTSAAERTLLDKLERAFACVSAAS